MASNYVKIFDDTVIKLSVNQGLEEQRISETLGTFTTGELAYTRDSGRLFVGDNSDGELPHVGMQETIGGSLVGNKYLGLIDSKPLVTFAHNGKSLDYVNKTTATGTQNAQDLTEEGLLTSASKFRLHSQKGAAEPWDNWDRTATYNPKYNAYNGDYMFDIYENALILFDTRISHDPNAKSQPQVKKNADGTPVSPETFIVNGKEIPSTSKDAIALTRRTKLQNYSKENDQNTNSNLVYGDGYVMLRVIEPDNQTIRFKPKAFQNNGLPTDNNNYNHNVLEVFSVPLGTFMENFSDDFYIQNDLIWLTKDLKYINSITSSSGIVKVPGTFGFSNANATGRGATTYMEWKFNAPTDVSLPTTNTYQLELTPTVEKTDGTQKFVHFDVNVRAIPPKETVIQPPYYIKLEGGLESNNTNPHMLIIDASATGSNTATYPILTVKLPTEEKEDDNMLSTVDPSVGNNPYNVTVSNTLQLDTVYTDNLGFNENGQLRYIDEFAPDYYAAAKAKVDRYQEQNTSINYLKTPVTIAQSNTVTWLYGNLPGFQNFNNWFSVNNPAFTLSKTLISYSVTNLVKLTTGVNQMVAAFNSGTPTTNYKPTWVNHVLTVPNDTANTSGVGIVITSPQIGVPSESKSYILKGQVSGVNSLSTSKKITIFLALVNNGNIVASRTVQGYCNNLSFEMDLEMDAVCVSGTTYFAWGLICNQVGSQITCTITDQLLTWRSLSQEQVFEVSNAAANAYLDFEVDPYVYCARKVMSSPIMLPPVSAMNATPFTAQSAWYNGIAGNVSYVKTWNNLFYVLGRNHFANNKQAPAENVLLDDDVDSGIKKSAFYHIDGYEAASDNSMISHTDVIPEYSQPAIFSWWKEYTRGSDTGITYYILSEDEQRENVTKRNIDYVRIQGSNTNLIAGNVAGVVTASEPEIVDITTHRERVQLAIYAESALITPHVKAIEYGGTDAGGPFAYDLNIYKNRRLELDITFDLKTLAQITCIKADGTKVVIPGTSITKVTWACDENLPTNPVSKFEDYQWILVDFKSTYKDSTKTTGPYIYKIANKSVSYAARYGVPGNLGSQAVFGQFTDAQRLGNVTVDETIASGVQVYIPSHARNIILQISHNTTENNTIAIFYANVFEDLGVCLPGLPINQYNNPTAFTNDIVLNPSYNMAFYEPSINIGDATTWKLNLGGPIYNQYHVLSDTIDNNKNRRPDIFNPAPKETCIMLTSASETRIVEVPLHKVAGSKKHRHFCLRVAGIRPSSTEVLNQLVIRVLGYRV